MDGGGPPTVVRWSVVGGRWSVVCGRRGPVARGAVGGIDRKVSLKMTDTVMERTRRRNCVMNLLAFACFATVPLQAGAFVPTDNIRRATILTGRQQQQQQQQQKSSDDVIKRMSSINDRDGPDILQASQSLLTGAITAAALLFLNPTIDSFAATHASNPSAPAPQIRIFQPRAVHAADDVATATAPTSVLDDSLPSPDAIGTMSSPNDASNLSPLKLEQRNTVLDEVWRLVDKYYIDRSFNAQDWNYVRDKYEDRLGSKPSDDKVMQLTTDMVKSLGDKYSRVLDKSAYARIQKFDLIGVGATLMPDANKQLIVGAPPIPGSAADRAGLKVGDFIDAVNGLPTDGRTAFDIIDQIGENPNAKEITMTVRTQEANDLPGEGISRDVAMAREFAEVKDPVSYKVTERRSDGTNVGYIRINEFNSLVKPSLEAAIKKLEEGGVNAFVLDVRSNPGGAFQSAVEISGLFMKDKVATSVVDSNLVELPFKTPSDKMIVNPSDPVVIWIDGGSASATEVLAGALRDNCRAVVMGSKSFGKGLIQAVYGLKNGSGLVLTVAKYVTPSGTDIQGSGIQPDITGNAVPANILSLVMSTDTTKVDFNDVKERLSEPMCKVPQ